MTAEPGVCDAQDVVGVCRVVLLYHSNLHALGRDVDC